MNVAEQIADICHREGVRLVSGVMGGSATNIVRALDAIPGRKAIYMRQERVAIDACDGYARITGDPGVAFTDAGPGAANAMCGIVNSWGDSVPVLLFAPIHFRFEVFAQRFTKELPVTDVFGPVSKWTAKLYDPSQVETVMRNAFTALRAPRSGPVVIGLPRDLAKMPAAPSAYRPVPRRPRAGGAESDVEAAVKMLGAAARPFLYVGAGVLTSGASEELRELAELLSLPVATTLNAKSVFPETHPLALGIGGYAHATYSTLQADQVAQEADVVLAIACGFKRDATKEPVAASTKLIQVDVDPGALNSVYPADLTVLGDAKTVLRQMIDAARSSLPASRLRPKPEVAARLAELRARWWDLSRPMLTSTKRPIDPFRVTWEFSRLVDHDRTVVLHDAGGTRGYICQHYEATTPGGFVGYGVQSAMGWSLGAAMGVKAARPDRLVVAFIGDEAFCETAMDIESSVASETPILVVLLNNRAASLAMLERMSGERGFNPTLGPLRWGGGGDLCAVARALGADATRVDDPEQIRPALERAVRTVQGGRTSVVEFVTSRAPHIVSGLWGKKASGGGG
ncbi:MAG TPA: thiamine pyrophosphate-dependent enzyme [Candidatus Limnocylindria bacterium]|nr:thiamine pyrophosphate-dependent enzyme [Candidatus Limnocylindria bacterium]